MSRFVLPTLHSRNIFCEDDKCGCVFKVVHVVDEDILRRPREQLHFLTLCLGLMKKKIPYKKKSSGGLMNFFISLFFVFMTTHLSAQVVFNNVTHRGTGCPQGTLSTSMSPDGTSFSVLFDEFRVEVPQYDGINDNTETRRGGIIVNRNTPSIAYKACHLSFSANIPEGTMADSLEITLTARGATYFDQGIEGFFASILVGYEGLSRSRGRPTIVIQKHWRSVRSEVDDNWTAQPVAIVPLGSSCATSGARSIRFDLKNHINVEIPNNDLTKSGLISIDSADAAGLLKFKVRTRRCGSTSSPAGRRLAP